MPSNNISTIVIENGSSNTKAGFGGKDLPLLETLTIVGKTRTETGEGHFGYYIGKEALLNRTKLILKYPVENGIISDWNFIEKLWNHLFNELKVDPKESPILLTECTLNSKLNREKTAQIMFETFSTPLFNMSNQASLSLYDFGKTTGTVLDIGESYTYCTSVYDGFYMPHSFQLLSIGGRTITEQLYKSVSDYNNIVFKSHESISFFKDVKENMCYVAQNYEKELETAKDSKDFDKKFELPDGTVISLGNHTFMDTEGLFQSYLFGMSACVFMRLLIIQSKKLMIVYERSCMKILFCLEEQLY